LNRGPNWITSLRSVILNRGSMSNYLSSFGDPGSVNQDQRFFVVALRKRAFDTHFKKSLWGEQDSNLRR
ncbi:hypothetical protein, partial [Muriicola sp.]|uniref:hypothetical protein n=1 Tax=Muriicola sp. TaxID=2020856 RepID=UPI00356B4EF8